MIDFFKILGIVLAYITALFLVYQVLIRIIRKFVYFPAPAIIGRFLDSDLRRSMQPPAKLIERSGIQGGMDILEIGCGSGAFTTFAARATGNGGIVYALDIQQGMLDQLSLKMDRKENSDIKNVRLILGSAYQLPIADGSVDLVYLVSVFQEIPDSSKILAEIKRVLKTGGILAISEFLFDPDYPLRKTTVKQGLSGGFTLQGVFGNYWNYTVRFIKV